MALRNGLGRKQGDFIPYAIELLQVPVRHTHAIGFWLAPERALDRGSDAHHISEDANLSLAPQLQTGIVTHMRLEQRDRKMGVIRTGCLRTARGRPQWEWISQKFNHSGVIALTVTDQTVVEQGLSDPHACDRSFVKRAEHLVLGHHVICLGKFFFQAHNQRLDYYIGRSITQTLAFVTK